MHPFLIWCDERTAFCMAQKKALQADGRGDEARFMQIHANVYGIFRIVFGAAKGDLSEFSSRLTSIPASWEAALTQAEKHGDAEAAHIERIKLETINDIRHCIQSLQGGEQA